MASRKAGNDLEGWVQRLARPSERQRAKAHLLRCGFPAVPAIRRGLRSHADPMVRATCAKLLDQLADDEAIPDLVAAVDDPDPTVAKLALHALACDRCKQGACRPGDDLFVPRALELVRTRPEPTVRAGAIDALAQAATRDPSIAGQLLEAIEGEPISGLKHLARQRLKRTHTAAQPA
jgi:HEAT repeat protein